MYIHNLNLRVWKPGPTTGPDERAGGRPPHGRSSTTARWQLDSFSAGN